MPKLCPPPHAPLQLYQNLNPHIGLRQGGLQRSNCSKACLRIQPQANRASYLRTYLPRLSFKSCMQLSVGWHWAGVGPASFSLVRWQRRVAQASHSDMGVRAVRVELTWYVPDAYPWKAWKMLFVNVLGNISWVRWLQLQQGSIWIDSTPLTASCCVLELDS